MNESTILSMSISIILAICIVIPVSILIESPYYIIISLLIGVTFSFIDKLYIHPFVESRLEKQ